MKIQKILYIAVISLAACASKHDSQSFGGLEEPTTSNTTGPTVMDPVSYKDMEETSADSTVGPSLDPGMLTSSASTYGLNDTSHRFIRTADVRFKVADVRTSTTTIENLALRHQGYVQSTHLSSSITWEETIPVSEDSSLKRTHFSVSNAFIIRVPAVRLDTFLRSLSPLVQFLDYRNIELQDVKLDLMRDQLLQKRNTMFQNRLQSHLNGNDKLIDEVSAEENLLNSQERKDLALLNSLELEEKIRMATITLNIYQAETILNTMVANPENIERYRPGFWHQAGQALESGWDALLWVILALLHIWWVILIVAAGIWLLVRSVRKRA